MTQSPSPSQTEQTITYETAVLLIGRMLMHFPSRQTDKDGVIISDLAADCVDMGVTESGLSVACLNFRREASSEKPFLPPSGEILSRAVYYSNLAKPKPLMIENKSEREKFAVKGNWNSWGVETKKEFIEFYRSAYEEIDPRKLMDEIRSFGIAFCDFEKEINNGK